MNYEACPNCGEHHETTGCRPRVAASELNGVLSALRERQKLLTPEDRKDLWRDIMAGYCSECGYLDPQQRCQCWNDE